jgi:copper chaperone NosL
MKPKLKKTALNIISAGLFGILLSCSTEPEPINFGKDQCDLCKMTITDTKFGAEIVTKKGKAHKFDAAECMMNSLSLNNIKYHDSGGFYVIDAANPKQLIDAVKATYLISEHFPSPMGADLSAFANRTDAEQFQKNYGGELKSWDELKAKFKVK